MGLYQLWCFVIQLNEDSDSDVMIIYYFSSWLFDLLLNILNSIHPSIHLSKGLAHHGVQCPLTSSLSEFLG